MEYSSPLAAMHPQQMQPWCNRRDLQIPRWSGAQTFGPNSFNFKDLSMKPAKTSGDYFTMKPVRGSSPTSSLTADLDANFHIDKSPQVPTPRRSLFTLKFSKSEDGVGHDRLTPPVEYEVTTPPVPSSSPGIDSMDISPLPHKPPFFQVTLPSPSPEETPADEEMIEPDLLSPDETPMPTAPPVQAPVFLPLPERRRPVTRPGLSRTKGYSTNCVPFSRNSPENQLPPFRFGNALSGLSCSSTLSLGPPYTESPVEMENTKPFAMSSMLPPRRPSLSGASRASGSPVTGHVRKPSNGRPPLSKPPRKQMRRSLSMFQHPNEVMKEEKNEYHSPTGLQSVMDVDDVCTPRLPHFVPEDEPDSLPRISQETMVDIINMRYNDDYDVINIIDCRFEYEFEGGHIDGAVNFNDKNLLANELFKNPAAQRTLLVFHCEYSVHRAPLTAKFIRGKDREHNAHQYPSLNYPEIYILDGGYSKFFSRNRSMCEPQNYVEMLAKEHEEACEQGMGKLKQRAKLGRAQTFAFGQTGCDDMEDSPTAGGRGGASRSFSTFDVGPGIANGLGSSFSRRMASY